MTRCTIAPVGVVGDEHLEPVAVAQAADVEVLLHRVRRREQPDVCEAALRATASAVVSAMWTNGTSTAPVIASATLCIVFVHRTSSSAPAAASARASAASSAPASSQRPSRCSASISAKSTERSTQSAECSPPSRSRVASLTSR